MSCLLFPIELTRAALTLSALVCKAKPLSSNKLVSFTRDAPSLSFAIEESLVLK